MKRIVTIITALLLAVTTASSQGLQIQNLYEKYKGEEGVVSVWVPGIAIKLASSIADLERSEARFLRSIRSVRVLTIDKPELYPGVNFTHEVNLKPGQGGYQLLVKVHDGKEDVVILGKEKNGKLKDLLVLVGGEENVMVHIKGRMHADMIESLADIAGTEKAGLLSQL